LTSVRGVSSSIQEAFFNTEDGKRLHGWFFPGEKENPVILHFHGNAGNISHRLDLVQPFLHRGFSVFLFDYRGFGKSSGRPSETGLYKDGLAAWAYLVEKETITPGKDCTAWSFHRSGRGH